MSNASRTAIRPDFEITTDKIIESPHYLSSCYTALNRDFSDHITTLSSLGFDVAALFYILSVYINRLHLMPYFQVLGLKLTRAGLA